VTPAVVAARRAGIDCEVLEYRHTPRVFKTLVASLASGKLAVAVIPVTARLDLKALAAAAGSKKAEMADPAAAERATGYVVGGISPLGQRRRLELIYVSAGRRGLEIALRPRDLAALTGATLAAVTR
jgi:Cys-tRNA(Pro)/Cys-tRNA(Cys) deacylase